MHGLIMLQETLLELEKNELECLLPFNIYLNSVGVQVLRFGLDKVVPLEL